MTPESPDFQLGSAEQIASVYAQQGLAGLLQKIHQEDLIPGKLSDLGWASKNIQCAPEEIFSQLLGRYVETNLRYPFGASVADYVVGWRYILEVKEVDPERGLIYMVNPVHSSRAGRYNAPSGADFEYMGKEWETGKEENGIWKKVTASGYKVMLNSQLSDRKMADYFKEKGFGKEMNPLIRVETIMENFQFLRSLIFGYFRMKAEMVLELADGGDFNMLSANKYALRLSGDQQNFSREDVEQLEGILNILKRK